MPTVLPDNPFGAMVPVDDDSNAQRAAALRIALITVIKEVAGSNDSSTSGLLSQADRLVQHYSYIIDEASQTMMLRAAFDAQSVKNELRALGLPIFGVSSEFVEAWIVEVRGIRTAEAYAGVKDHFSSLQGVRRVVVDELNDDHLRFRMIVEGGMRRAAEQAGNSGILREDGFGNFDYVGG